jgi:hypothetical protein
MDLLEVSQEPERRFGLEFAYAGQLDLSECEQLIVHHLFSDQGALAPDSEVDISLETVVSLSFQGRAVF